MGNDLNNLNNQVTVNFSLCMCPQANQKKAQADPEASSKKES